MAAQRRRLRTSQVSLLDKWVNLFEIAPPYFDIGWHPGSHGKFDPGTSLEGEVRTSLVESGSGQYR